MGDVLCFLGFSTLPGLWQETLPRDTAHRGPWPLRWPVTAPCGGCSPARTGTWLWRNVGSSAPLEMLFDFGAFPRHWRFSKPLPRQPRRCLISIPCRGTPGREPGSPAPGQGLLSFVLRTDQTGVRESSRNHPVPRHAPGLLCLQPLLPPHCGAGLRLHGVCGEAAGRAWSGPICKLRASLSTAGPELDPAL